MSEEHLAYWQWYDDVGGGYQETFILSLYADRVELVAHVDYRGSRPKTVWTLAEAKAAERSAFDKIPDGAWAELRASLG